MVKQHHQLNEHEQMSFSQLWERVDERGAWHAAVHGITELATTQELNNNNNSDCCETIPHCSLICIFQIINDVEHLFMCLWPSLCLLWRNIFLGVLPILTELFVFWILSFMSCLYSLEINPLSAASFGIISVILRVAFSSCLCFFCCAKAFKFNQILLFCFYFHYYRRWVKKDLAAIYVKECSAYVCV